MKQVVFLALFLLMPTPTHAQYVRGFSTDPGVTNPSTGSWVDASTLGSSIPAGLVTFVVSGVCPTGWSEVAALAGKTLVGTVAANKDVGGTGGADSITPAGTNGTVAFTPAGTNGTVAFTPAGAISYPANVPLFTGTPGAMAAHTISWPAGVPIYTWNIGTLAVTAHTSVATKQGSSTGNVVTTATHTFTGAAASTIAWPAGVPTENTPNFTPVGTIAWPANPPTFGGTQGTVPAQTFTGTQGTVPAEAFTGTSFDNRSSFVKVIFCSKN